MAGPERDEEPELSVAFCVAGVDDDAVANLVEFFDHTIELARTHAHAAAVQRGVRAPRDDGATALVEDDPVAVAPDARILVEVALAVARTLRIVPEVNRHARHWARDHELTYPADDGTPRLVKGTNVRAERATLELAAIHGEKRTRPDKRRT